MRMYLTMFTLALAAATAMYAADAKAGKAVYDTSCKSCHGTDGTPNPAVAKMMKVEMQDLKSSEVQSMSEADIVMVIEKGKGKMQPVKAVTGKSADNVAAYVHTLKK
ncbi:MAG TPA: cytochrome c [Bryobacteraceae bacterium]|nr:cytochrome c [Bryobacteraceae bacterium]